MSDNPNVSQSDLQQAFESYHQIILPYLGGGGSGGSTYTLLFEGTAPTNLNTNNLTSSSASVELSDSIEHYEFIEIFFQSQEPFNTQGSVYAHGIMPVSAITPLYTICAFETSEGFVESSYTYFSRQSWGFYDSTHISRCWESYSGWTHNANHLIVYGIKNGNIGNNSHRYSTEEQVVGKWIDGRPLYEKVFKVYNISARTAKPLDISGIDTIFKVHEYWRYTQSGNIMTTQLWLGSTNFCHINVSINMANNNTPEVYYDSDTSTTYEIVEVLRYTKIADTPSV